MIARAGVPPLQPMGHALQVLRNDPRFPLAPLPPSPSGTSLMVVLRPELEADRVAALLPALRDIGRCALDLGGRLYLMSIDIDDPHFLECQFGDALPRLRSLKRELDPADLLSSGFLR
jgi:hypothetical protein